MVHGYKPQCAALANPLRDSAPQIRIVELHKRTNGVNNPSHWHSFQEFSNGLPPTRPTRLGRAGRFDRMNGKIVLDRARKSGEVDIAVAAASINTGDPRHEAGSWAAKNYGPQSRDEHLRTALAAQNGTPTIVFIVSLSAVRERPRPMPKLIDHPPSSTSIAPYSVCA
jgi:hypothetical protein